MVQLLQYSYNHEIKKKLLVIKPFLLLFNIMFQIQGIMDKYTVCVRYVFDKL